MGLKVADDEALDDTTGAAPRVLGRIDHVVGNEEAKGLLALSGN